MIDKCHFIGIGGIGMSGLARILLEENADVSGSDASESSVIDDLRKKGANVTIGHDRNSINSNSTVIYSSGIPVDNPEYQAAVELKCKMLHRSDLLLALLRNQSLLGVTGTHGKTTTSALLAHLFSVGGLDPSFAIGGIIPKKQINALKGKGQYFIAELDESDGSFLKFHCNGAIITNIGSDHMDYFGCQDKLIKDFKQFCSQVKSSDHFFWCGDNMYLKEMSPSGTSYGFSEACQLRALNLIQNGWSQCFDISYKGVLYSDVTIPLIGSHNVLNSLAVFGLGISYGISEAIIREAFNSFLGVSRRCEKKGEEQGVLVIDDYAHHPTEISATLNAIRQAIGERRLIVIYQPHRYTRVQNCLGSFGGIFDEADEVIVTDIYSAGEKTNNSVSHQDIIEENEQCSTVPFSYVSRLNLVEEVTKKLQPHDVVVTLGAGDITHVGSNILDLLKKKSSIN